MRLRFFTIPALEPTASSDEVSAFLSTHRIHSVDRQFVSDGPQSFWSICITCGEGDTREPASKRQPKDYRELERRPPPDA